MLASSRKLGAVDLEVEGGGGGGGGSEGVGIGFVQGLLGIGVWGSLFGMSPATTSEVAWQPMTDGTPMAP